MSIHSHEREHISHRNYINKICLILIRMYFSCPHCHLSLLRSCYCCWVSAIKKKMLQSPRVPPKKLLQNRGFKTSGGIRNLRKLTLPSAGSLQRDVCICGLLVPHFCLRVFISTLGDWSLLLASVIFGVLGK